MEKINFNKAWDFLLSGQKGKWRKVDLPHDYSIEQDMDPNTPLRQHGGYYPCGLGHYVKRFDVPAEWKGKKLFVEFEGVYMNAEVMLNGNMLGRHPYGYTGFCFDMTKYIKYDGTNELKVTVDNSTIPNSRWYSGSGIYRNVWLYTGESPYIKHWGVYVTTEQISEDSAKIKAVIDIEGYDSSKNVQIKNIVCDVDGKEIAADITAADGLSTAINIILYSPKLWDIDSPYLYTLKTEIISENKITDTQTTVFGVRTISVDSKDGFRLNGKTIKMKGGCVHHDNGIVGAASYARAEERKVELLKASGFNAIRCAHNPPSPVFLDACDRLGMLVIDEAFDCWKISKTQYDYHVWFEDWWERDIDSMVKSARNHPSVVIWSTGNEIVEQSGGSDAYGTSKALAERIRALDTMRPVALAVCPAWNDADWRGLDGSFAPVDIAGYNYSFERYESDHVLFPDRVMAGTETSPKHAYENWSLVEKLPYVIGDFVWTSMDYLGEAAIGRSFYKGENEEQDYWNTLTAYPWNAANCGDIDICGFKRPQSYYRDIVWGVSDKPYISVRKPNADSAKKTEHTSYWGWHDNISSWNFQEGTTLTVDVYAPGESVELFLNGKSLGKKPLYKDESIQTDYRVAVFSPAVPLIRYAAVYEVPYEAGELKAVADNGQSFILKTAGTPCKSKLTPDRSRIGSDGDLSYVTVEIVDADGLTVTDCFADVNFNISGNGTLLAVSNNDPKAAQNRTGNHYKAHYGKLMAVVKSISAGNIILRANADQIDGGEVRIEVRP